MKDGHCVLVADDEDVQSEVVVELLDPAHGQVRNRVLLEVETFEAFGVVLDEHTLALRLGREMGTYLSCLTIAQIIEFQMSR